MNQVEKESLTVEIIFDPCNSNEIAKIVKKRKMNSKEKAIFYSISIVFDWVP